MTTEVKECLERLEKKLDTIKDLTVTLLGKVNQTEIKVTRSDKIGDQFLSYGVSRYIQTGQNDLHQIETLSNDLNDILGKERDKQKQAQAETQQTMQINNQTSTPTSYGLCNHCGAPNAWSVKKNKPYCSKKCFLNNNNYNRQGY